MKNKLLSLLFLFIILIIINGCTDTFGTDPNVRITELNPTKPEPTDSIKSPVEMVAKWNFVEYFSIGPRGSSMAWGTNHKLLRNRVVIDTTKDESIVWLDIEVNSTIPDEVINNRNDRVVSMRLSIDSLSIPLGKINNTVDPNRKSLVRVDLVVKDLRTGRKYIINEKELGIIFSVYQETKNSGIRGFLNVDLGQYVSLNTFNFQAIFEADFK